MQVGIWQHFIGPYIINENVRAGIYLNLLRDMYLASIYLFFCENRLGMLIRNIPHDDTPPHVGVALYLDNT